MFVVVVVVLFGLVWFSCVVLSEISLRVSCGWDERAAVVGDLGPGSRSKAVSAHGSQQQH